MESRHLKTLKQLLRLHVPGRTVWLFGSRARGQARPASDADVVILGASAIGLKQTADLREALSASGLPFRVDVVQWVDLSNDFRSLIEREHSVLQEY